jgi:hypothetical protein
MTYARGFEHAVGWIISQSGRAHGPAIALVISDASALAELVPLVDATSRDLAARGDWRTARLPTSPPALALRFPAYAVAVFRRTATELHLVSTPYEALPDEDWGRLEAAATEEVDRVSITTGIVGLSALNEDLRELAAAEPMAQDVEAREVGITGEGVLVRVEPGEYALSHARYEADEDVYLDLYRLRRTG